MSKSRLEINRYVNPPCMEPSDRKLPICSQFCPTNFITVRTWLPGARDLWYRGEAASYHSSLTSESLITLDILSLHASSVLWSQSRSTPNFGVKKPETSRQVDLCSFISSSQHLWFGWCGSLGQVSVCYSSHGQRRKRMERNKWEQCSVSITLEFIWCFNWSLSMTSMFLERNLHLL